MNPTTHDAPPTGGRQRRRWFWPAAILTIATGVASVVLVNQLPPAPIAATVDVTETPRPMRLHPLEIVTVQPRLIEDLVKVTGTLHPVQEAAIAAQVGGLAETVTVRPGDYVEAGQLLVEVGTTDLQLQLDQQRSTMGSSVVQLRAAQTTLERTKLLADKGLAAKTALDGAQADVDGLTATIATQQSQVALAEANLLRARVLAPFAGTVASRSIEPGQIVSPGTTMLSIVDLSTVRVEVVAALKDSARIVAGQSVRLAVQGMTGQDFIGTVDRVSPVAETGTRSIKVYLNLDNTDGNLRGGMFVTGEIVVQQNEGILAVPTEAIVRRDEATFVMAIVDGVLNEHPIETGSTWLAANLVEARSGISAGDTIVATDLSGLTHGAPVIIEGN
ncbi:efflux RND transporter periplasmic adaptor subunit [Devosia psychrophila]|uniref:RND family efflux transporter, MFP subunit n=1 Tax=Devosia psychrophila TaxID=728005 RepID=A0A1I1QMB2_9HYPH|nr:efflux RND transporter periplasmic adaptor subunit [Devosia psychrophila]SFD23264.1 RND family efflux transporter, MFP subunit [Devosia psychrophila]